MREAQWTEGGVALAIALASLAVYAPVLGHEPLNYDDPFYVTRNPQVLAGLTWESVIWAFDGFHAYNWHPLTWLSHMLGTQLFGGFVGGRLATNAALHAVSAALLFGILRGTSGTLWASAFAAALFALHPLRVESVAWLSQRKDVLAMFFGLAAVAAWARYALRGARGAYGAALAFYAASLLSKPTLVTLPLLLLLLDHWPLSRGLRVREKLPFLALAMACAGVTLAAQQSTGALVASEALPFDVRLVNAAISGVRYLGATLWPAGLAVYHPYVDLDGVRAQWPTALLSAAVLVGLTAGAWRLRHRHPFVLVGWLWYLVALAPVIGLVQAGWQTHADRYSYLPSVGIAVLIAFAGRELRRPRLLASAGLGLLLVLAIVSAQQLGHWRDSASLFRRSLEVTGPSVLAHNQLGAAFAVEGRFEQAGGQFEAALALDPDQPRARANLETMRRRMRSRRAEQRGE